MRTRHAISIAALSGALAAPPAIVSGLVPEASAQSDAPVTLSRFQISQARSAATGAAGFDTIETRAEFDLTWLAALSGDAAADRSVFGEAEARWELEGLTDDGLRWGARLSGRAQLDDGRRGLAARAGDCPPGNTPSRPAPNDCAAVAGRPARGAAGGFYTSGPEEDAPASAALEDAHIFVRSGWGEVRLGGGEGAAALESLPGAGAFRLARADGGRVDPTGLAGARTRSMASGHAPKLVLTSQRFGQAITIGAFGASLSYTPRADDCGVDLCLDGTRRGAPLAPRIDHVVELAAGYERRRGDTVLSAALGVAQGEADDASPVFGPLEEVTASLGWERGDWRASLHYLSTTNGLDDGDYSAAGIGLSREAGPWLAAVEAAWFSDDFAHVDGRSVQIGASRLIGDYWVWGGGLSHVSRDAPELTAGGRVQQEEAAWSAFTEIGLRF